MLDTLTPPTFALADIQRAAKTHFGLVGTWTPLEGERDQNFKVVDGDGTSHVFKLCNAREPQEIVRCQAAALAHVALADPSLPVPQLRLSRDGKSIATAEFGGMPYRMLLLSYLPGAPVGGMLLSPPSLRDLGRLLGRLARALRGFVDPAPASRKLVWDNRNVGELLSYVDRLPDAMAGRARRMIEKFVAESLPRLALQRSQIVHADAHPFNVLIGDKGEFTGIIDFGDLVHATLVQDIANAMADFLAPGAAIEPVLYETLRGYCEIVRLEEEELDLILDMVEIRLLMTPLIGVMKEAEGHPVQGYLETFGERCLPLLKAIDGLGRDWLIDVVRRAGSFPPRRQAAPEPVAALFESRKRLMGKKPLVFYDPPLHIVSGEGVWLTDADGRRYLDCYNNVPHVGHCHPYVAEAIVRQARRLNTNTRYLTDESLAYAARLTATMDKSLSAVVFVNSGSEANDVAWRMAKCWTGKSGGLAMDFAYHGVTESTDDFSPSNAVKDWHRPHIRLLSPPDDYRGPYRRGKADLAAKYAMLADRPIAELQAAGFGLAATMIDGAFMTNGMLDTPPGYVRAILDKTHAAGGLYIADEVQAGFGRMGSALWGHQHHGIVPDFVTIGKPAGNGHPIGAVVTRPEILEHFVAKTGPFFS
ncbi:MAG: aminotransferase class III-fold pyridoxal phosphate-dependent enzyme, partial [Alphaproteobacteria bacterium]|nr:aminotransferase class III-fold pyridoxal phosphate-dependent enzyme [Alphaproteobacteria bacterium]